MEGEGKRREGKKDKDNLVIEILGEFNGNNKNKGLVRSVSTR